MQFKLINYCLSALLGLVLLCSLFNPPINGLSVSKINQRQETYVVNETFDLGLTQTLSYQFPLWLDWVGTHARVRVEGGVINGRIPDYLNIEIMLDGIGSQQSFEQMHRLQTHYTFHSDSEYILWIQAPNHPTLEGVQTLHNLTVELDFMFTLSPEGTGIIHQIIFETFTPLSLVSTQPVSILPLQEQFSWRITAWSFGTCYFSTPLILPLAHTANVTLIATVEFSGIDLDGWELIIEQGAKEISIRDNTILEAMLELDPTLPSIIILVADPPRVSEPTTVSVKLHVQGTTLPITEANSPFSDPESSATYKTFTETLLILQLTIVSIPLLIYYRKQRGFAQT